MGEPGAERPFAILLVEDESEVRDALVELVRHHGFDVHAVADGYAAIRVLMAYPIDLMLTDVVMPGLSGFELGEQARLIRPALRILYLTGYADRPQDRNKQRYGKVLHKPIGGDELAMEIRQALAR
jgi:CheY-like chemotaxis protein